MRKFRSAMCRLSVLILLLAALPTATVALSAQAAGASTCVRTVSGPWKGTYAGSGSGTWSADFEWSAANAPDTATGTFDAPAEGSAPLSATVACAGAFSFTAGSATFQSPALKSTQSASGTWQLGGYSGTWQGSLVAPQLSSFTPSSGGTSDTVTIRGSAFTDVSSVHFGDAPAAFTVDSDSLITATVPVLVPGPVSITVTGPGGSSQFGSQFTFVAEGPVVSQVTPAVGPPGGGTSVTITGKRFTGATGVSFGTSAATSFVVNSDTSITATSPSGSGGVDVTVQTGAGSSAANAADRFVYTNGSDYPSLVNGKSPLAYWRLGESADNPVAGDSSGNGRDGVYDACVGRGAPGAIAGDPDTAATFLANDCGVTFTPSNGDSYSGDFTAEAWVNPAADTDKPWYTFLSSRFPDSQSGTGEYSFDFKLLGADTGHKQLFADIGNGSGWMLTNGIDFDWQPSTWYDVAVTVDATNGLATFYVDGQSIGSLSFTPQPALLFDAAHPMEIGQVSRFIDNPPPTEWFDGTIDEVALYPGVLSSTELLSDYNGGVGSTATVPDAPTIGTATAQNGSATVNFTPPANDGGSSINNYSATCSSSDGGATASASGAASPINVPGLTAGNTYTCDVVATNDIGSSSPSGPSNSLFASDCAGSCVSVGDASVLEGDSGTRTLTFPVTLSQPATTTVTADYDVAGVTATGGTKPGTGVDFLLASGAVTFKPGTTGKTPISKTVAVTVYGDTNIEPNETLTLTLSNASGGGYVLGRNIGTGTIINDDGVTSGITMGIGDSTIVNAHGGSQNVTVPVTLSAPANNTISVNYTVTPHNATYTAKATGGDFGGALSGTLKFAVNTKGQTPVVKNITFPIWPDSNTDTTETFTITLSGLSGTGVTVIRPAANVTILSGY